jgi:SAM-dependent methyltransferase
MKEVSDFFAHLQSAIALQQLAKLTLGNKRIKDAELRSVFIKPVTIKNEIQLSFVYRYPTKDITKNYNTNDGLATLQQLLRTDFFNADAYCTTVNYFLLQYPSGTAKLKKILQPIGERMITLEHDRTKQRLIDAAPENYLHALGITGKDGVVKKERQDKFKQINRYVEIIDGILKDLPAGDKFKVADMGCGKGYLTFALYDHLTKRLNIHAEVTGIEIRKDLVDNCNQIAQTAKMNHLHFVEGSIVDTKLTSLNMLIALHACDTATDDAIFKGVQAGAAYIVCAPCCHKQIRKQMKPDNVLAAITKHGILLERQAEMVTDTLRGLLLETLGYKTRIFDFIESAHTPKNVMIVAEKIKVNPDRIQQASEQIIALKALFGIQEHHLEKLIKGYTPPSLPAAQ